MRTRDALADVRAQQELYDECFALYYESLHLKLQIFGRDSLETVISLEKIGIAIVRSQRGDTEAMQYLEQSLTVKKRVYGTQHLQIADLLENIGVLQSRHLK